MTIQPFTLSWAYRKQEFDPVADEAGLSQLAPRGTDFVKQLRASLKSQSLYSRGAMLTSLSLLAACGGGGGGSTGGTPPPPPPPPPPANNAPVAGADVTLTVAEDAAATSLGISAPTDADAGDTLTITIDTLPTDGDLLLGGNVVGASTTLTAADIGNLQYRPDANDNGGAGVFTYTVSDGTDSDSQTVTIDVTPVNDAPVAGADTTLTVNEDAAATSLGLTAPTDVDTGDTLTITIDTLPTEGDILLNGAVVDAMTTLTAADIANLQYRPDANENGAAGVFTYTVSDGTASDSQTVTISVTAVNDAPVAGADTTLTVNEDAAATSLGLTAPTDVDTGDTLTITVDTFPTDGDILLNGAVVDAMTTLTVADIANLQYRPDANDNGAAGVFTYTASDGTASDSQTVTISVTAVNDAPVAGANTTFTVAEDAAATSLGLTVPTDVDTGDTLTITIDTVPADGDILLNGTVVDTMTALTPADIANLQYRPDANDNGPAGSFTYTVSDGTDSDTQVVTISVTPVDDAPIIDGNGSAAATAGTPIDLNITQPQELDGDLLTITVTSAPTTGQIQKANGDPVVLNDTLTAAEVAGLQYVTAGMDSATDAGTFSYSVTDGTTTVTSDISLSVASGAFSLDGAPFDGSNGYTLSGAGGDFGASIAGGGDINNDGVNDLIVGAPAADTVFVIFGGATTGANLDPFFDLGPGDPDGFRIGGTTMSSFGSSVAIGRDVNGDMIDDFAVAATGFDQGGAVDTGNATFVFGSATVGNTVFNITGNRAPDADPMAPGNNPTPGFRFLSEDAGDLSGTSIAFIGDVNNDGVQDVAMGSPGADIGAGAPSTDDQGQVSIVFGQDGAPDLDTAYTTEETSMSFSTRDAAFDGPSDGSGAGQTIAALGDINGDMIDDFIIGVAGENGGAGEAIVVFGNNTGVFESDLSQYGTDSTIGFTVTGQNGTNDMVGSAVAGGGDFNGDGIQDILIGASGTDQNGAESGQAIIIFGRSDGSFFDDGDFNIGVDTLDPSIGVVIGGASAGENLGAQLAAVGDFNDDGFDDFAVTAENGDGGNGAVAIVYGRSAADFGGSLDLSTPDASSFLGISGGTEGSLGRSLAGLGDVNGDGHDDVAIGAQDNVTVLFGFDSPDTGVTSSAESIIALDNGIALPDSTDGTAGTMMPMDTAEANASGSSSQASGDGSAGNLATDIVMADDIDLSGIV